MVVPPKAIQGNRSVEGTTVHFSLRNEGINHYEELLTDIVLTLLTMVGGHILK